MAFLWRSCQMGVSACGCMWQIPHDGSSQSLFWTLKPADELPPCTSLLVGLPEAHSQ